MLLLLFNAGFLALSYWDSLQNLNSSRDQIQQQFKQDLSNELVISSTKLQQLAELMLLPDNNLSVRKYLVTTTHLLNNNRTSLEVDWQLSHAQYLDASGNQLAGWGEALPKNIRQLIPSVIENGIPQSYIHCGQECIQFNLIPVLIKKRVSAMLVVASDISDTLLRFTQRTGTDIAILSKRQNNLTLQADRFIPEWNMNVHVLTSLGENKPYLDNLAKNYSSYAIKTDQIIRESNSPLQLLKKDISPLEFHLINSKQHKNLLFIIIDNIAAQYQEIIDVTYRNFLFSLISLLIIALSSFFFISRSLSRLTSISKALPLIAQQRYADAKSLIPQKPSFLGFSDEFTQLEKAAFELTSQQESLYDSVKGHTIALSKRSEELQQERDFIQSLINTAQMVIITMDKQCLITSFNHFSEEITGYASTEIVHSSFERFFPIEQWSETKNILTRLQTTDQTISQQESELINRSTGTAHIISWLYSSLNHLTDDSVILAVGLDITEKKRSDEHIIWLAEHDVLTELYNRRKFNATFEQLLNNAKRFDQQGALLFLDLDQFKDINDRYGHKAGDQVLKHVAETLLSLARTTDSVARLGGDEFAIILPQTDQDGAINFAQKIIEQLAKINTSSNSSRYKVTTSIGIVQFPLEDQTIEELISNADIAMYQAKAKGKNTWHQFNVDDTTRVQLESRVFWKQQIENALENNRFILHYQPIMNIQSEAIDHYEVLIRMLDDNNTIHPPSSFIHVAEQTGLIHDIDHFVIKNSIKLQAELKQVNAEVSLSVNLSAAAINDSILVPLLKRLLKDNNTNSDHLIFELSETATSPDIIQARDFIELLNSLGYRFSLDDFGKDASSFHSLRELPVDFIKIDGAFIVNLVSNEKDRVFVQALVDLAKGMGKKTVAEFVEDAETLSLLKTMGVDFAQGYYIGKPKPYFLDGNPLTKPKLRLDTI
ncbi:MAG: EAL domain-containing protein [Methylophaga sp.]|nr:EAL domain-containing protein [Methylophaga sp.]